MEENTQTNDNFMDIDELEEIEAPAVGLLVCWD